MKRLLKFASVTALLGLTACVTVPNGPSIAALPGSRRTFEQFQIDDARCRQYASAQTGGPSAADNANQSAVNSAVVGTIIGAAAGAAIGGSGEAAGVGAGVGLLTGSAVGMEAGQTSYYATQQRYDSAYTQCMYAAGHQVALPADVARAYSRQRHAPAYPPPDAAPPGDAPGSIPPPNAPPPR